MSKRELYREMVAAVSALGAKIAPYNFGKIMIEVPVDPTASDPFGLGGLRLGVEDLPPEIVQAITDFVGGRGDDLEVVQDQISALVVDFAAAPLEAEPVEEIPVPVEPEPDPIPEEPPAAEPVGPEPEPAEPVDPKIEEPVDPGELSGPAVEP